MAQVEIIERVVNVEFLYRDESNYKTFFSQEIDLTAWPAAAKLKVGDEITMGQYGTLSKEDFFESEFHQYAFGDDDHNILEVVEIAPMK